MPTVIEQECSKEHVYHLLKQGNSFQSDRQKDRQRDQQPDNRDLIIMCQSAYAGYTRKVTIQKNSTNQQAYILQGPITVHIINPLTGKTYLASVHTEMITIIGMYKLFSFCHEKRRSSQVMKARQTYKQTPNICASPAKVVNRGKNRASAIPAYHSYLNWGLCKRDIQMPKEAAKRDQQFTLMPICQQYRFIEIPTYFVQLLFSI